MRHFAGSDMKRDQLADEIRETKLTLNHLIAIGEIDTATQVARYLLQLREEYKRLPALRMVKLLKN